MKEIIEVKKSEKKSETLKKTNYLNPKFLLPAMLVFLLLASVGSALYFYSQYHKIKSDPAQAQADKNKAETQLVLDKVKMAILITETDQPTVARVEDPAKLQESNKEFYKDIQKGDYLIIYPKRAIIYRESNNQIINVAPIINTSELQNAKEPSGTQPASTTPASNSTSKTSR